MTYSTDFRKPAPAKLKQGLSIRKAAKELGIGSDTLFRWTKNPIPKTYPKDRKPFKITKEALFLDVEQYPDAYCYERAERFNCSTSAIHKALQKYGISRKKDQ
ncbi:IS630 transposase-related protein [Neisseria sp. ZJ106]|uniref:IS630 transposase-related protein n=1 Tax=Neisseria lisongii TaxID=2912188 RepID=A0ABY7RKR7_9NEIS|nr:IS630 transposase-related protein [Neisseria lisongii]MCF7521605.1 IS630 transposase-related protein [Neisseria lisongii]WCL71793.1 IS630 transposase-related protein [Neisseria lisongii]